MAPEQDETGSDELLEMARWMRQVGSAQPGDLVRAADSDALDRTAVDPDPTRGDRVLERVLRVALRILGTVLGSVRVLVLAAVALAVIDAGLFLLPRRDQSLFLFGAVVVLSVALLPAFMLNRLGKRFAAFRDAVTMVGTGLPQFFQVPEGVVAEFQDLAPLMEKTAGKRLPGRIIGSARVLLRLKKLISRFIDEHRDLFSATTTVFTYGPQDVLLAVWGISGTVALAMAMPLFALWAILA